MAFAGQVSLLSFLALLGAALVCAASGGNLYSSWQLPYNNLPSTINLIDPNTGAKGEQVFSVNLNQQFSITPAIDQMRKRIFIPYLTNLPQKTVIMALDFSDPSNVKNLWNITNAPQSIFSCLLYDPVLGGVFIVRVLFDRQFSMVLGFADATTGTYRNITTLPQDLIPGIAGITNGAPMALDIKNRVIVFGSSVRGKANQPMVTVYDINSQRFNTQPSNTFMIFALVYRAKTQQLLSIVGPYNGTNSLSVAILDPSSASYKILSTWDPALVWMTGALITLDEDNGKFYSLVQKRDQSLGLATADTTTGKLEGTAFFGDNAPFSVFYL